MELKCPRKDQRAMVKPGHKLMEIVEKYQKVKEKKIA